MAEALGVCHVRIRACSWTTGVQAKYSESTFEKRVVYSLYLERCIKLKNFLPIGAQHAFAHRQSYVGRKLFENLIEDI